MGTRYHVPINTSQGDESTTVDIVTLVGTKKQKRKQWREYLQYRCNKFMDVHEMNAITRGLHFNELL